MQTMLTIIRLLRRRPDPRNTTSVSDPRSGAPVERRPDPVPRMRWY
jgi:hypothetical protein